MSQRSVEILLGKILTDEDFRRAFFTASPAHGPNFETADRHGLDLTPVERRALSSLRRTSFETLAERIDPRLSRSSNADSGEAGDPGNRP